MRQGLAAWRATGAEFVRPYYLALLAEAYGKGGQVEEGLSVLAEALVIANRTGERFYEAELYRLKGELSLKSGVQSPESGVRGGGVFSEGHRYCWRILIPPAPKRQTVTGASSPAAPH